MKIWLRRIIFVLLFGGIGAVSLVPLGYLSNAFATERYKWQVKAELVQMMATKERMTLVWLDPDTVHAHPDFPGWYVPPGEIAPPWAFVKVKKWGAPYVVEVYWGELQSDGKGRGGVKMFVSFFGLTLTETEQSYVGSKKKKPQTTDHSSLRRDRSKAGSENAKGG